MGVPDKLTEQAAERLGQPVVFATMVVPPGATLYSAFSKGASTADTVAGPIAAALASKTGDQKAGQAGTFPRQMGVLAVTGDRLVFHKKRLVGVGCGKELTSWPRSEIAGARFDANDRGSYPGVVIDFADGTNVAIFGEKRWNLAGLADALGPD